MNIVIQTQFNLSDEIKNNGKFTKIRIRIKKAPRNKKFNRLHPTMASPKRPGQMANSGE